MIGLKNATAALGFAMALGLAVAAASPALAKERTRANHPGHAAQAQAIGGAIGDNGMNQHRTNALRTCNERANRLGQITYGVAQSFAYSSCMMEQGETP